MLMVSQTSGLNFGNAMPHPLDAYLSADPLVDSVLYRCFGRDTTKLANDGEQFHVADLRREWWRLCQSHLPFDCGGQSRFHATWYAERTMAVAFSRASFARWWYAVR